MMVMMVMMVMLIVLMMMIKRKVGKKCARPVARWKCTKQHFLQRGAEI